MCGVKKYKKGILFTADALFAAFIIVTAIVVLSQNFIQEDKSPDISYLSYDIVKGFSVIKTGELNNSYLKSLIGSEINNTNQTLLETIGELYVLNNSIIAKKLAKNISSQLIPLNYGFAIAVDGETVYTNNKSVEKSLYSSKRLISGIEKFKPIKGSASKVYLQGLDEKKDSSYIFFGGFIGQGNISKFTEDIPSDAVLTDIYMEMEIGDQIGDEFEIYFNDNKCNGNFNRTSTAMQANAWDLSSCISDISPGSRNNVSIYFIPNSNFGISYISGGFIRFDYATKQMFNEEQEGYTKYYFPSIDGLINLYTSVYIPGEIDNMNLRLSYEIFTNESNSTFYLKVGNTTVWLDNYTNGYNETNLGGSVLISYGLNYSFLSGKNIPLRLGAENLSYYTEFIGTADSVLVTDVSGSMDWRMDSTNTGTKRNCDDPNLNLSSTARLSIAKCLDKEFASDILNISGNLIGLISYDANTHTGETVTLTTNLTLINNTIGTASPETGYEGSGGTCICCGINSAYDILMSGITRAVYLASGDNNWLYNLSINGSSPPVDNQGDLWYERDYDDSSWSSGTAVLGSRENGVGPAIVTDMGSTNSKNASFPNLWDNAADNTSSYVDFSSGLNYTGNTFGESGGANNDGWDSNYGYFSTGGTDVYMNADPNEDGNQDDNSVASNEDLRIYIGNNWDDDAPSSDETPDSGAYGIELFITSEMLNIINSSSGTATLYFDWKIDPTYLDPGEQGWIKAQFGTSGNMQYLGTNMDENGTTPDGTPDVFYCDDTGSSAPDPDHICPNPGSDTFQWNLSSYINQSGWYYLVIGAIATENPSDSTWDENWRFYFDNILIEIRNETDYYYLRKHFNIADTSNIKKSFINLMSDDIATIYVNGNQIYQDSSINEAKYWNKGGVKFDTAYLFTGDNVVAVELLNSYSAAKFDLELITLNYSRNLAMMVMTDGQANYECGRQGSTDDLDGDGVDDTASDDAIQAACDAAEDYGINVYSVGFSNGADLPTLVGIADCGGGMFKKSDDIEELKEFYKDIAAEIMDVSRVEQKIVITGNPTSSKLYGTDSYIEINYTPPVSQPQFGEIAVRFEEPLTNNCTFNINISPKLRIVESQVSGYSSSKWFDFVLVNNNATHNLSIFNPDYQFLGDPFIVGFDPTLLSPGSYDNITIRTGTDSSNSTGCSKNSTFFYTGLMKASVSYSDVLEFAIGCKWTIEFEDATTTTLNVPPLYNGSNTCSYESSGISYNNNDTYDDAMYNLMKNLDLDEDGRVDINLVENNFIVDAISLQKVPYPWGPAIAEVQVWQ